MSTKKHAIALAVSSVAIAASLLSISSVSATTINFDDIPVAAGQNVHIDDYADFTWRSVAAENNIGVGPGYVNGIVSQTNAIYNEGGNPGTFTSNFGTFSFNSAYFIAAFAMPETNVVITDNLGDSKTFAVTSTAATLETFNWNGVSSVTFLAKSGERNNIVVIDDMTINAARAAPEVSTWVMVVFGFAGLGFAAYQRRGRGGALA
jgi:hypothetical protein